MKNFLLAIIFAFIFSLLPLPSFAQERCIGSCPSGTTLKEDATGTIIQGETTCYAAGDTRPLPITGLTCARPGFTPTTNDPSQIDSCVCKSPDACKVNFKCDSGLSYDEALKKCIGPQGAGGSAARAEINSSSCASGCPSSLNPDSCTCVPKAGEVCPLDVKTTSEGLRCQPGATTMTRTGTGIMTAIGCVPTEPKALVEAVLRYGVLGAGGIAFILMILAAFQMITAEGNPNTIKTAQEKFYSAIIGLLLIIFSVLLMQVIGVDLLGLQTALQPNTTTTIIPGAPN